MKNEIQNNECLPYNLYNAGRKAIEAKYTRPKTLLSKGETNAKLAKNSKYNWNSYILYLAPYNQNSLGVNLCPHASKNCAFTCLFTSGRGAFSNVVNARKNKTEYYLHSRIEFINQLMIELNKINNLGGNNCVRLNGTSDIDWFKVIQASGFGNPLELFPNIQFYDYTKSIHRVKKYAGTNYHLTFSRSETNDIECLEAMELGVNVAKVYINVPNAEVKDNGRTWIDVFNGDESDLRFLDPKRDRGIIIGLKAKGKAKKDVSGFVIH